MGGSAPPPRQPGGGVGLSGCPPRGRLSRVVPEEGCPFGKAPKKILELLTPQKWVTQAEPSPPPRGGGWVRIPPGPKKSPLIRVLTDGRDIMQHCQKHSDLVVIFLHLVSGDKRNGF